MAAILSQPQCVKTLISMSVLKIDCHNFSVWSGPALAPSPLAATLQSTKQG